MSMNVAILHQVNETPFTYEEDQELLKSYTWGVPWVLQFLYMGVPQTLYSLFIWVHLALMGYRY
jgi:hypothetical protein